MTSWNESFPPPLHQLLSMRNWIFLFIVLFFIHVSYVVYFPIFLRRISFICIPIAIIHFPRILSTAYLPLFLYQIKHIKNKQWSLILKYYTQMNWFLSCSISYSINNILVILWINCDLFSSKSIRKLQIPSYSVQYTKKQN